MAEHPLGIMYENQVRECDRLRAILAQAVEELRGHDDRLSNQELRDTVDDFIAAATAASNQMQPPAR